MNIKECCIFSLSEDLVLELEGAVIVCMPMGIAREVCILGGLLGHESGSDFVVIFYKSDFWTVNASRVATDYSGVYMQLSKDPIQGQEDLKAEVRELLAVDMNAELSSGVTKH